MTTTWLYGVVIALLMAAAVVIQMRRDEHWQPYAPATAVMWLRAGPATERATLGYDALVADLYWMRTVVYFGQQRRSTDADKNYDLLYPMLELVTSLDPHFSVAYRFGAFFLTERPPDGPGRPDLAIQLLERGIERNPTRWEYLHDIAFVYYFSYQNYAAAAEWFRKGSELPGAPVWMRTMAAVTLASGGERESSRMLWREVHENAAADAIKETALTRLAQLDAVDEIDRLNQLVWRYQARTGRFPASWRELIAARVLRGVPRDPSGEPLVLDPVNEDVRIARSSALWFVPVGMEGYRQ